MEIMSTVGYHYAWASPQFIMEQMTMTQLTAYYDHLNYVLNGKRVARHNQKPDKLKRYDMTKSGAKVVRK